MMNFSIDYRFFDDLPVAILITKNWNVIYASKIIRDFLQKRNINKVKILDFLDEQNKIFLRNQLLSIRQNQTKSFSVIVELQGEKIPVLCHAKLLKEGKFSRYFFIVIQKIFDSEVTYPKLNAIILETFTLYGKELFSTLMKKIVELYELQGALLLKPDQENIPELFSYYFTADNVPALHISRNLQTKIQKHGFLIIEKKFYEAFPHDTLWHSPVETFIGLKIELTENEYLLFVVFSEVPKSHLSELLFTLNICSIKILNEYIREYYFTRYENFYNVFLNTSDGVFIYDPDDDKVLDCNPAFSETLEIPLEKIRNHTLTEILGEKLGKRYRRIFDYCVRKEKKSKKQIKTVLELHGREIPLQVSIDYMKEKNKTIAIGIVRNLSLTLQAYEEHRNTIQMLNLLKLHVVELDKNLNILYINHIPNSSLSNLKKNDSFLDYIQDDYQEYVRSMLENLYKTKIPVRIRFPKKIDNSKNEWYEADFVLVRRRKKFYIRGFLKNIQLEYLTEKQILQISDYDLLTSLPNKRRLEEDLYKAIARADKNKTLLAIGFINLDRFFYVNELMGHRLGDLLLSLFAEKLLCIPEISHRIYRWGGDQFVFFMENLESRESLSGVIEKLKNIAKEPYFVNNEKLFLTFSTGISLYPADGMTLDTLFGEADKALNYAKQNGRYQVVFASDLPKKEFPLSRLELQSHILEAIAEKKIYPSFQPIYDIQNKRVVGLEALARLNQSSAQVYIGPDIFIPLAEDLGLIEELSFFLIKKSFELFKKIREIIPLYLSINISRRLFHTDYFIQTLVDIQQVVGIEPQNIVIEITETVATLNRENIIKKLEALRKTGYKIAIDDFGIGYSSLGEIQDLPVDILKIDKSFVKNIRKGEQEKILEAIVFIAESLNLTIVAEGVENIETLQKLKSLGIRYAQGYYFSPPIPEPDLEKTLLKLNS